MTLVRCPRCEAAAIGEMGALSRTTRDEGAAVFVCQRCGEREALYGRDPSEQIPFHEWPVEVGTLLTEERLLITRFRESWLGMIRTDEITAEEAS